MEGHRHRAGSLKQQNKGFKSGKHDSKGAIKRRTDGKVENRKSVKSLAVVPSRQDLLRQKSMKSNQSKKDEALERRRLGLPDLLPPRIVTIIALSENVNIQQIKNQLLNKKSNDNNNSNNEGDREETICLGQTGKTRATILECKSREMIDMIEYAKIADIILFVVNVEKVASVVASQQFAEFKLDETAERLCSVIKAQGVPSSMLLMQGFEGVPVKRRNDVKKVVTTTYHFHFPEEPKVLPLDTDVDADMVIRFIESMHVNDILWRNMRPYLVVDQIQDAPNNTVTIQGYLRGNHMNAKQLIYLPEFGDHQISKIEKIKDPNVKNQHKNKDGMNDEQVLDESNQEERESLESVNVPDPNDQEQTMPTAEEIANATKRKLVPKGTSEYQASWYLDDEQNDEEDGDDDDEEDQEGEDEDDEMIDELEPEIDRSNINMMDDEEVIDEEQQNHDEEINNELMEEIEVNKDKWKGLTKEDYKRMQKERQELDGEKERVDEQNEMDFPDEIDSPEDFPARVRFSKYRGLKSFRSSPWNPRENLPFDYARISQFHSYNQSMRRSIEVQRQSPAKIGTYVRITIVNAPLASEIKQRQPTSSPLVVTGLLRYENKVSVLHFALEKHRLYDEPIRSKQEVVFHVGFRRYSTQPIYSLSAPNCDKQKFEKFLLPGRNAMATIYAPITFVPAPLVVFSDAQCTDMVATGRLVSVNPDRIIAKRIILTGRVAKSISRKFAVVRDMFYFPDDIEWFRKVELYSKMGRVGHIRDSLGTHGYMKCLFDGTTHQQDTICMNLYKRVYPKWLFDVDGQHHDEIDHHMN